MSVLLCSWLDCNRNTYMDQKLQPPLSFNLSSLCIIIWTSLVTQMVKHLPRMRKTQVQSLGWEDLLEKGNGNPLWHSCLENPMDGGAL